MLNQTATGLFICRKRKEKNLTQSELAERLGVSNKTVSKWETGKCMPDYGVIEPLCKELGITVGELMDGEEAEPDSIRVYDEKQTIEMMQRIQQLENRNNTLTGVIVIVLGIALMALSNMVGGTDIKDFCSGVLLGLGIGIEVLGVGVCAVYFARGAFSK